VKIASDETTSHMSNASLGKSIKKSNLFFIEEEHAMFSWAIYQTTSPYGFKFKFGYFCIHNFFIHGYSKLQNVRVLKFCFGSIAYPFGTKVLSRGFKKQAHQCDQMFFRPTTTYY
jgi:hypothetical protein